MIRQVKRVLGHESWVVRRLRPYRERLLQTWYGGRGMPWVVNGVPLRVLPEYRAYFSPDYDAPVARYFRDRIGAGTVCLCVGANLGVYPLQFAHWAGPGGRVYAFEPNPAAAAVLRSHVRLNGFADRVTVVDRAVSDLPGQATLHASGVDGRGRLGAPNPALEGRTTPVTVAVDSLDRFCAAEGIAPDAVMIDVEGFEVAALRGGRDLFTGRPPRAVVVEMHSNAWESAGTDRATLDRLLSDYRLRVVPLSGQADPFVEYGHVALEPVGE